MKIKFQSCHQKTFDLRKMQVNNMREEKKQAETVADEIHAKFMNKTIALKRELNDFDKEIQLLKLEQSELAKEITQTILELENFQEKLTFMRHKLCKKPRLACEKCEMF